ncbi:MAG TPA: type II toxin-antitoxin system RelE/ParE family toxin [Stellaceae bacterium]|nr:type II toxin-antitoxin system RelE/ParE family toxin [Stellaceae bacterium]
MARRPPRPRRRRADQCPTPSPLPGQPGRLRPVGAGVSELRIDHGPGYRIYLIRRGPQRVVLLGSGDKSTQDRDIERAK